MIAYEKVCKDQRPDWIVVVGDVNSTLACALVGAKLLIPVAHLEAGLRSGDRTMPEEINRIVTDSIADVLWTPSPDGNEHLAREGVAADKVELVGNIMLDSFEIARAEDPRGDPRREVRASRRSATASSRCIGRRTSTIATKLRADVDGALRDGGANAARIPCPPADTTAPRGSSGLLREIETVRGGPMTDRSRTSSS